MASAMSRDELLKHYTDKIKALELQMAKTQKEAKSYDLRSGARPVMPAQNLDGEHLQRVKQAHRRMSEKKDKEVTTSNLDRRSSRVEQIPFGNMRKEVRPTDRREDGNPENSGHASIGLFEDIEPEDLDEQEVIWSDKNLLMFTPYADWQEGRPGPGARQGQRIKEVLRRQSTPEVPVCWEEAEPVPPGEKAGKVANREKNLETSASRGQLPHAYYDARGNKRAAAVDETRNRENSNPFTSVPGRMFVKPPKFDGKGCVESHLLQFQVAASRNHWSEEEKVDFLKISLVGEASAILKDVGEVTYEQLANKLKQCYGSLEQKEVFKIQLKARKRKKGETLAELMKDIRRLFMQAYPAQNDVLSASVAKDAFIDALEDKELMIRVMEREPQTLDEAYKIAERMELYTKKVNSDEREGENKHKGTFNKVRATSVMEEGMMKSLLENQKSLQQQMMSLVQSLQQLSFSSKEEGSKMVPEKLRNDTGYSCYGCGQEGHVKAKCPFKKNEKWEFQNKTKKSVNCYRCGKEGHISTNCENKANQGKEENGRAALNDQTGRKPAGAEKDSVRKIGRTLYARMEINSKWLDCLIDTGSEVNLIPAKFSNNLEIQPTKRVLQAANGTCIEVLGEVELAVRVAGLSLNTTFIVSDQIEEVLIGVDWLQVHGCCISFPENIMSIKGQRIPLLKKMSKDRCNRIVLQQTVVIPASSESVVPGKMIYSNLSTSNSAEHWATCTRECSPGVYVAGSVMPNRSQNLPVRVLNVKNQECTLLKGEDLTTVEAVQPLDDVPHLESKAEDRKEKIKVLVEDVIRRVDETVTEEEKEKLKKLLYEYQDVISSDELDLGLTNLVEHCIETGDAKPCRQALRRTPAAYAHIVDEQVQLMLRQGIIQPSVSDWSSNVVLVKKKDQTYRFCVDFRALNACSIRDMQPIPRIDSCLEALAGASWFTTLDMRSGFFQVKIREEDAKKTNFITRNGAFSFKVMPMGLCNSTATFQRLMNIVMAGLTYESCLVYLDDVIIFANSVEEHLERLKVVLERFRKASLKIRADKCHVLQKEVNFLGFRVNQHGVGTQRSKVEAIINWPTPRNLKETRSFVGLCSYYRHLVQGFAGIAEPLHALTKKGAKWNWSEECQEAFQELKRRLTSAPIMTLPQDDDVYILDTDASDCHIGAVLSVVRQGTGSGGGLWEQTLLKS